LVTFFFILDESIKPIKYEELPITMSIPSQSQSSPIIHFANVKINQIFVFCIIFYFLQTVRRPPNAAIQILLSPSTTFDFDSQKQYAALGNRPQSTPVSSPILRPTLPLNILDNQQPKEIFIKKDPKENQCITPLKTIDYSSFTRITPLNPTKSKVRFEICHNEDDDNDLILPNIQEIINQLQTSINNDRLIPRPPPLLALSQAIRRKHPEQLIDTKLNNQITSIKDLPNSPANYSFVFYGFTSTYVK
jgi:hypothetical protein